MGLAGWFAVGVLGLLVGSTRLAPGAVLEALVGGADPRTSAIVVGIRLPSVLLASLAGALLALAGTQVQSVLRNPLADPYILGMSGGAALGAGVAMAWSALPGWSLPLLAGASALGATAWLVARAGPGVPPWSLLLSGVVFNAFTGACLLILQALAPPERAQQLLLWSMGSLVPARVPWVGWLWLTGLLVLLQFWMVRSAPRRNLVALGEDEALSLGLDVPAFRRFDLLLAAVVTASVVAWCGLIGFVGLVVPHLLRLCAGADQRTLAVLAAPAGALFLAAADMVARGAFPLVGTVIPVGAITALVGAPLFLHLLQRVALPEGP
jgi:iron complex transport system permease protein